jgi:hypothetical protein
MSVVALSGTGLLWPQMLSFVAPTGGFTESSVLTIDASADKVAFVGRVWWADGATTKDCRKVHFRLGSVTAGTATFRVSLQDITTATGPPMQPDNTPDETWTVATSSLTGNAWNSTGNLSADRTMARGSMIGIVFDFSAFTSGASIVIGSIRAVENATGAVPRQGGALLDTAGSWVLQSNIPNVRLEASDGTYGFLGYDTPYSAVNTRTFNSGSSGAGGGLNAGDERGLEWTVSHPMTIGGCGLFLTQSAGSDCDVVLYSGTTALETVTVDANANQNNGNMRWLDVVFASTHSFAADDTLRLMVKPTSANNVSIQSVTLNNANDRVAYHGTGGSGNSRVDGGSFGTTDTTELPIIGLHVVGLDDGVGGATTTPLMVSHRLSRGARRRSTRRAA